MNCSPQLLSCPASTSSEEERVEKRKGYKGERAKKPKKHFVVFSWHEQINDLHFTAGDTIQSIKVKSWGTSSHRHRTHTHTHTNSNALHTHTDTARKKQHGEREICKLPAGKAKMADSMRRTWRSGEYLMGAGVVSGVGCGILMGSGVELAL